jgi:hypothetical protein
MYVLDGVPKMGTTFFYICYMIAERYVIKKWSKKSKELLYKRAYQRGVSLNEMIKIVIRDYLAKEFPGETIE